MQYNNLKKTLSTIDQALPYAAAIVSFRLVAHALSYILVAILYFSSNPDLYGQIFANWVFIWTVLMIPIGIFWVITGFGNAVRDCSIIATVLTLAKFLG